MGIDELPAMFKKLQAVEYNMFSSYHGKDRADSVGSMIVRWLRDQQSTDEGLKATQLSDTSGCSNSTCRSSLHRQQIYKHFVRDNRLSLRPFGRPVCDRFDYNDVLHMKRFSCVRIPC